MNIDGVNTLACLCRIEKDATKTTKVYPLPHSTFLFNLSHSFDVYLTYFSVCCQGRGRRLDPLLQAIQVRRAFPQERQPTGSRRILAIARGQKEARWNVRVYPLRMLLDVLPIVLVEPRYVSLSHRPGHLLT
jgi:hypothetical protein